MIREYKLKFDSKKQADRVIKEATEGLKTWLFSIKEIGIHKEFQYDEDNVEAEPAIIEYEGWHVDIVASVDLTFPEEFIVTPKNPIHTFAGI